MNFVSSGRPLYRACLLSAMALALCSHSALLRAASPLPVPTPVGPSVNISNPAAIAKAEGIQHPFQHALECRPDALTCSPSFQVGTNRRLVIEYVSVICTIPANTVFQGAGLRTTAGGTEVLHLLNHVDHPALEATAPHSAIVAHVVKLYADAGSTIGFAAAVGSTAGTPDWSCNVSLSGQSVDVP